MPFIRNCLTVSFSRNSSVEHKQKDLFAITQLELYVFVFFFCFSGSAKVSSFSCRVRKKRNIFFCHSLPFILNRLSVSFSRNSSVEDKQKDLFAITQLECFFFSVFGSAKSERFFLSSAKKENIFFYHHSGISIKLARVCRLFSIVCRFPFTVLQAWNINKRVSVITQL